jgi:hypothetical protein
MLVAARVDVGSGRTRDALRVPLTQGVALAEGVDARRLSRIAVVRVPGADGVQARPEARVDALPGRNGVADPQAVRGDIDGLGRHGGLRSDRGVRATGRRPRRRGRRRVRGSGT